MKTKSLFIALFITLFCFYANAQDSIKITTDANQPKNVCPKEITYYLLPPNSLYTNMTWKVTGGHFNYANSGIKQLFNTSDKVAVFWDNVASVNGGKTTGTVEVEVYISSQQKRLKGKYVQNIKSLNGVSMTKLGTNISTELPYEIKEFRVVADKLQFPKLTYDNGDPLNAKKYEWTLPAGWKSKSGKTGIFILEQPIPILDVITDANTNGTIKVRAINDCLGLEDASKFSELKFTRKGLGLGEYPQFVPLGEEKTYTFSVIGAEGTFEWKAPAGWKINGSGNTFTGGKSVQITTSKCPTRDFVQVRVSGTIPWTKFPTTIQLPAINIPSAEIKQYQSASFSLDMPDTNIESTEWFVNGKSVGKVANSSSLAFPITESGKVNISAQLTLKGCEPVDIPKIEVDIEKGPELSISGPTYNICDEPITYTIKNLPAGIPFAWSVSPDIQIISEQGNSITVKRDPNLLSMNSAAYIIADIGEPINKTIENNRLVVWKGGINETSNLIDISSSSDEYGNLRRHTAQLKEDLLYRLSKGPQWSVSDGLKLTFDDGTMIQFEGKLLQGEYIAVNLENPCGESTHIIHRFKNNE